MAAGLAPAWRDWSTEAFGAAHRDRRPVVLLLTARWSSSARRFEREVIGDDAVTRAIVDRFEAIRVDADRRPDIAVRYGLGDWPALVCLTPCGEVLTGGAPLEAERCARVLLEVSDAFAARRDELVSRARDARLARRASGATWGDEAGERLGEPLEGGAELSAAVASHLTHTFDDTWAGFGVGAKEPDAAAVAFALTHGVRTGNRVLRDIAVRTLDRLGWSDLSDARTGAFNRRCRTREWSEPDRARLLGVQAALTGLFLDAAAILEDDAYADRARAALAYVHGVLADPAGGFFESEREPDDADAIDDGDRIDRILVTSSNARMVRTLLRAADVLRTPRDGELALQAIERLVPVAYAQSAGVAHYVEAGSRLPAPGSGKGADDSAPVPRVRGLLVDQVETSAALLDLGEASGNRVYTELAEELMRGCLRKLWRSEGGGFLDRLRSPSGGGDIGRMGDAHVPFAVNCLAARVLAHLAHETGDDGLRARAIDTLDALAPVARAHGRLAPGYALALADVTGRVGV